MGVGVCSDVSDSLQPHGLQSTRLLCPWNFPGKNTGVGCHFLLQGIFSTQVSNPHLLCLLHCRQTLYLLSLRENPLWGLSRLRMRFPCRICKRCGFDPWVEKIPWRRKWQWQSAPVVLPGESHGQRSLDGYSSWDPKIWT